MEPSTGKDWRVVTPNAGLVTNHELLQLLRQRGLRTADEEAADAAAREAAADAAEAAATAAAEAAALAGDDAEVEAELGATASVAEASEARGDDGDAGAGPPPPKPLYPLINAPFPVERAVFERLLRSPAATQQSDKLRQFMDFMKDVDLTPPEILQLINTKPRSVITLHCLIENAPDRLTPDEQEDLLGVCGQLC